MEQSSSWATVFVELDFLIEEHLPIVCVPGTDRTDLHHSISEIGSF